MFGGDPGRVSDNGNLPNLPPIGGHPCGAGTYTITGSCERTRCTVSDPIRPPVALPKYPGTDQTLCQICGCTPAQFTTFRQHTGLIVLMIFRRRSGMFCRDCGLETYRSMTAATLIQGWWGIFSFFITPVVLLINLANRRDVAALPAPQQVPGGRRPVEPGPSLCSRPAAIVGVLIR